MVRDESRLKNAQEINLIFQSLDQYMLEQNKVNTYEKLIKLINAQLHSLLNPVATFYSEYRAEHRDLQIKCSKAGSMVVDGALTISGEDLFPKFIPVNDDMYGKLTTDDLVVLSNLKDTTEGTVPDSVSDSIGKALDANSYIRLAYMIDGQLYGTSVIALKNAPDHSVVNPLKTYACFTSMSLNRVLAEKALKQSEQELRSITDNMTDLVAMTDAEGKFTYLQGNQFELFGYKNEELLGRSFLEMIYAEDAERIAELFRKHISAGENGRAEYRAVRKDGTLVWVDTAGSVLHDNGEISGALFVTRDISELKMAEEALRNSEQELRTIADNMTDVVAMADAEGRFTYLSESNYQLIGYTSHELLGKSMLELIHEDDVSAIEAVFQEGVAEGRKGARVEYRVRNKNGAYIWAETIGSLVIGPNGQPSGALFVSLDISERKLMEKEITEARDQYQSLVNNMPGIAYRCKYDKDLTMLYISDDIDPIAGYPAGEFVNNAVRTYESVIHRDDADTVKRMVEIAIEKNQPWSIDYRVHRKDGNIRWVNERARGIYNEDGQVLFIDGLILDITEQKELDAKIKHMSFHDQLTDLYNRYYFESCQEELKNLPVLSVIMTDVNGLKLINDTCGHQAGDEVLKKYAALLRKSFKQSDLIFRWGGDEFIVILKNTREAKSWELCNRLIKHCGETLVKDIPLSISVGISSKLQDGDIDKAIQEAEDAMYKNKLKESKSSKYLIMKTLQQTLSEKSFETKEHIERMTLIGRQFGEKLGLSPSELSRLETLTMLHDIGKINIHEHILLKETALTDEEWEEVKKHPEVGYRITRTAEEFAYVAEDILAHHERWDGKGYPQGLEGEFIPYLARILNLVDSYDVMSNGRPYKKQMSREEIIEEIQGCSSQQFDPDLAERFVAGLREGFIGYENH